jgi:hypothetical protein
MTTKTIKVCDDCQKEEPEQPNSKFIILFDRSRYDLCDECHEKLLSYIKVNLKPQHA